MELQVLSWAAERYNATLSLCINGQGATVEFSFKNKKNLLENKLTEQIKCSDGVNFDPGDEIKGRSDQKTEKTRDF